MMTRPAEPVTLTPSEEAAVLAYLAAGSVKAAAHRLGLSASTVSNQIAGARRKAGVDTTAQLVAALGLRLGVRSLPPSANPNA